MNPLLRVMLSALAMTSLLSSSHANEVLFFEEILKNCSVKKATCALPYEVKEIDLKSVSDCETIKVLLSKADDASNIWSDTIFAGSYSEAGDTQLSRILSFKKHGRLLGYHVEFFARALYTGTTSCTYIDEWGHYGGKCTLGRIYDSVFVSADLKISERDEEENEKNGEFIKSYQDLIKKRR